VLFRHASFVLTVIVACSPIGADRAELPQPAAPSTALRPEREARFAARLDRPASSAGLDVPYDQVVQKSVHNAYARFEPLLDQLVYHRVRSVEVDIHDSREGIDARRGDWFVYHGDQPFNRESSCTHLSDCLGQLAAFHATFPQHEVVTLWVDVKDDFDAAHRPADLDRTITSALGRDNVVTPEDVVAACGRPGVTSVRDAVTGGCSFPTLRTLRGKFIVAVTGGNSCNPTSAVSAYGGDRPLARTAFLAPGVNDDCPVEAYDRRRDVVFLNLRLRERRRIPQIRARGMVARVYGNGISGVDDAEGFEAARAAGATHIATNRVNFEEDVWSSTHRGRGFPFACAGCTDALEERGAILGLRATSGDQGGTVDSEVFAYDPEVAAPDPEAGQASWSALVAVPSSHVEPMAKACLVARASTAPDAPSVSVCRPFDDHAPRALVRPASGAPARTIELDDVPGLAREAPAFLKLALAENEKEGGTDATALASSDGETWQTITKVHVDVPLRYRGIAVSSNGEASVKGLFANLVRERRGIPTHVDASSLHSSAVGDASGVLFDGVFPPRESAHGG
jgi:hypothetical protein